MKQDWINVEFKKNSIYHNDVKIKFCEIVETFV